MNIEPARTDNGGGWRTGRPPHGVLVEALLSQGPAGPPAPARLKAVHGGDGNRPHWANEDETECYDPACVAAWRPLRNRQTD